MNIGLPASAAISYSGLLNERRSTRRVMVTSSTLRWDPHFIADRSASQASAQRRHSSAQIRQWSW